jgi:hypothetical protein
MRVTVRVMRGRAGNRVCREPFGDGVDAESVGELGEDPTHDYCRSLVDAELMQPLAVRSLGRVGVRASVDQAVSIGRPAAQEPALKLRLRGHRGPSFRSRQPDQRRSLIKIANEITDSRGAEALSRRTSVISTIVLVWELIVVLPSNSQCPIMPRSCR